MHDVADGSVEVTVGEAIVHQRIGETSSSDVSHTAEPELDLRQRICAGLRGDSTKPSPSSR